jgi:undecaprenyl-diphosphatase
VELWKAALLGLVQGLTEFFPVSSDGHLVALERFLDLPESARGADFVSFLHFGTLAACLVAFRREVLAMLALVAQPRRLLRPPEGDALASETRFVLLGSIATAVAALPFLKLFEALYHSKLVLVACLATTGALLVVSRFALKLPSKPPDVTQPLLVGGAQMLAILPGLSRSCSTVVVGLLVGVPLARVAPLSFLLSIPASFGAVLVEAVRHPPGAEAFAPIAVGVAVAFVVGLVAVRAMLWLVPRGRMHWFAPYMFLLAAAVQFFS